MSSQITLEQVEQMAVQLPPREQLRLICNLSDQLSRQSTNGKDDEEYFARMDEFIKMSDEMAVDTDEEFDSAEDIRQIREERASRL